MINELFTHKLYHVSLMPRESGFQEQDFGSNYPTIYVRARSFTEAIERVEQAYPSKRVYGINVVTRQDPNIKNLL